MSQSVTGCDVDHNQSNDNDFCCTEEELFESFMEIVNDPELQGMKNNNQEITENNQTESKNISDQEDRSTLITEGKESGKDADSTISSDNSGAESGDKDENNDTINYQQVSSEECPPNENKALENNLKNEEKLSDIDDERNTVMETQDDQGSLDGESNSRKMNDVELEVSTISNAQDSLVNPAGQGNVDTSGINQDEDLTFNEQNNAQQKEENSSTFDSEQISESKVVEPCSSTPEKSQINATQTDLKSPTSKCEAVSSIILPQPTSPKAKEGGLSSSPKATRGSEVFDSSIILPQPKSPKAKEGSISSEQKPSSPRETEVVSSILLRKPTSPKKAEKDVDLSNEIEVNGSPTNENEAGESSTNENEANVNPTNENEAGESSTNSNTTAVSPTSQNKLEIIENNIEESIRKTNKVCEELAALTQRLSQSSDELLADNDSDRRDLRTVDNDTKTTALDNSQISDNSDISKQDGNSKDTNSQSDNNLTTRKNESNPEVDDPNIRPETLPKLIVTSQPSSPSPISPKPKSLLKKATSTPSPTIESQSPTQGFSPTHIIQLRDENPDRKLSVSDSLDSSEGSLSAGGASPSDHGPINWEILNSAFEDVETDEDDNVYEPSGSFGGFGLVLDEDNESITASEEPRNRSVSEISSTVSELEFQNDYKTKHSTGSLDRNVDGVICSGYLFKLGGTGITPKNWRKRWCVLRHDRCLYYYKSTRDKVPCGIVVLANYIVSPSSECNKKNCIKISKGGGRTYFFSSETQQDMLRWMDALRKAAEKHEEGTTFVIRKEIIHNVAIPALSIKKPDCHGYLTKQGAKSMRSWKRRYCVLKNGCLYYYREMADTTALGVAKLHGYTVDEEISAHGRRNGFRCVPPHSGMRTFTFIADNEYDKKRWIPCFRESIQSNSTSVVDS